MKAKAVSVQRRILQNEMLRCNYKKSFSFRKFVFFFRQA